MRLVIKSNLLISCLLLLGCSGLPAYAQDHEQSDKKADDKKSCLTAAAPTSLVGKDLVLQIEKTVTQFPSGYPYKGAVVKRFNKNGKFTAQGTGTMQGQVPEAQQFFQGTYKYRRTGFNTAIEKSVDTSVNNTAFTVKYTFDTETSGHWEEDFGDGQLLTSGSFTLEPSSLPADQHLAPANKADTSVALIIKSAKSNLPPNVYPTAGLVLQTYAPDGTTVFKGFGPGTVNSTGTYKYTKISANTAVEEVTQVSEFFTFPYTMVYTFDTPSSGKWFQNFGDGLIIFQGTFDTFPAK